jgi:hypothetical protein
MDFPAEWTDQNVAAYLVRLREMQALLIRKTQEFLQESQRKRVRLDRAGHSEVSQFQENQFVLLQYPNRPTNKVAGLYHGSMVITGIDCSDLI